jgi:Nuclease-related domain
MAWPKLRNRKSPIPSPDAQQPSVAVYGPADPGSDSGSGVGSGSGSGGAPSFLDWAGADDSARLDDLGDGLPEEGPGDDGVTDVDPPAGRLRGPVVAPVGDAGEQPKAEGIGQHLGSLAHLSANPRMRAWQWRAIIALIAGLVSGFLLHDWRWGLTVAVLAAIADTIYRSRRGVPGPPGVRLTGAQKRTISQLASLERKGYRSMNILPIPGSDEQIDHLVIGPAGVFAIDSEEWDKRLPVRTSNLKLWHGPRSMTDRLEHASWEAEQAAKLVSAAMGSQVVVRPAMAVYGPEIPWDVIRIRDVDTFSGPRLRKYLRRRARRRDTHPLSTVEIERIDKAAHVAFGIEVPLAGPASR